MQCSFMFVKCIMKIFRTLQNDLLSIHLVGLFTMHINLMTTNYPPHTTLQNDWHGNDTNYTK